MQHTRQSAGTTKSSSSPWYQIYFAALLESDQRKAARLIECARGAIYDRLDDLRLTTPNHPRELQDLGSALTYLGILLDHIGDEGGSILWD